MTSFAKIQIINESSLLLLSNFKRHNLRVRKCIGILHAIMPYKQRQKDSLSLVYNRVKNPSSQSNYHINEQLYLSHVSISNLFHTKHPRENTADAKALKRMRRTFIVRNHKNLWISTLRTYVKLIKQKSPKFNYCVVQI